MSNIFVQDIMGDSGGDLKVPATDAQLSTATTRLDTQLQTVASLAYDRVLAWVETADGAGASRTLNCLVEKFTYSGEECPDATETQTLTAAIETAIEAYDPPNTTVNGPQDVHIFAAGAYFLWQRDATGGFLYPNTTTDDIAVGGHVAPNGKWFDDGDLVLGASAMSGAEVLRVVGDARVEGGVLMTEAAAVPLAPAGGEGTFWIRNDTPNVPMFTDDGGSDHVLAYLGDVRSFPNIQQVMWVDNASPAPASPDGTIQAPYTSINSGLTAINALTPGTANRYTLFVMPGVYVESVVTQDDFVDIIGFDPETTIVRQSTGANSPLDVQNDNIRIENITFECSGDNTARVLDGTTSLPDPVRIRNCAFLANSSAPANNYVLISGFNGDWEFYETRFVQSDSAQRIYDHGGNANNIEFYDCTFVGQLREDGGGDYAYYHSCSMTSSNTGQTVRCGGGHIKFFEGCNIENTAAAGDAVGYGGSQVQLVGCSLNGGSSSYDVDDIEGTVSGCAMQRGMGPDVELHNDIVYAGGNPGDMDWFQTLQTAVDSVSTGATGQATQIIMMADATLTAQLPLNINTVPIVDGQKRFTIDGSGVGNDRIVTLGNNDQIVFKDVQLIGTVNLSGNSTKLRFERVHMTGQVDYNGATADSLIQFRESYLIGDATWVTPLIIGQAVGKIWISGSYLKGHTGNAAIEYDTDGGGTTFDFDDLYIEYSKIFHGSKGANNPFTGQGQGGAPPVNDYYAHHTAFNIEPAVADAVNLNNKIVAGNRHNTIDDDADYFWLEDFAF